MSLYLIETIGRERGSRDSIGRMSLLVVAADADDARRAAVDYTRNGGAETWSVLRITLQNLKGEAA